MGDRRRNRFSVTGVLPFPSPVPASSVALPASAAKPRKQRTKRWLVAMGVTLKISTSQAEHFADDRVEGIVEMVVSSVRETLRGVTRAL